MLKDYLIRFRTDEVEMVGIRKYDGDFGNHVWTFVGYDFVIRVDKNKFKSLLADEETYYRLLPVKRYTLGYDNINQGDVTAFQVGGDHFGLREKDEVSLAKLKKIAREQSRLDKYHFVYNK